MTLERIRNSRLGRRYIGDRAFYALVLGLLVPIVIQNIISNFVSLLDNIMVGAVSTEEMPRVKEMGIRIISRITNEPSIMAMAMVVSGMGILLPGVAAVFRENLFLLLGRHQHGVDQHQQAGQGQDHIAPRWASWWRAWWRAWSCS